jgi:glycosyltransferase involved in cell wall biosynthesis
MPRVAIVSDTVDDINGVAIGLRRLVAASRRAGHAIHLIGAARAGADHDVVRIPAALDAALPFYPDMTWTVPELPALTHHLARSADIVQLATPGPMGIAGLIAGRMLGLPVIAQYHTEVAEYAARMTGLALLRTIIEPIVGWFYKQADLCLAPSQAVVDRLVALGVPADRIQRIRRGVDLELFHPARRIAPAEPTVLYVGRLSKEKNLDALAAAWTIVHRERPAARLVVVGEGPLAGTLAKLPKVVETGPRYGEDLSRAFASADVFAFPSETETFGNVVVEAAASGLPAVVAAAGAAHEHVIDGITGVVATGGEPLAAAIVRLLDDGELRARMGCAARAHAASYALDHAVRATWDIYRTIRPALREAS